MSLKFYKIKVKMWIGLFCAIEWSSNCIISPMATRFDFQHQSTCYVSFARFLSMFLFAVLLHVPFCSSLTRLTVILFEYWRFPVRHCKLTRCFAPTSTVVFHSVYYWLTVWLTILQANCNNDGNFSKRCKTIIIVVIFHTKNTLKQHYYSNESLIALVSIHHSISLTILV